MILRTPWRSTAGSASSTETSNRDSKKLEKASRLESTRIRNLLKFNRKTTYIANMHKIFKKLTRREQLNSIWQNVRSRMSHGPKSLRYQR